MGDGRTGVVLLHRGDPTSPGEARAWLRGVYADPLVTRSSFGREGQRLLAGFLAWLDASTLARALSAVGGRAQTDGQARTLADAVAQKLGPEFVVRVGFGSSAPSIGEAVQACVSEGCTSVVGVPLHPQPCPRWTEPLRRAFQAAAGEREVSWAEGLHLRPEYVEAVRHQLEAALFRAPESTVVFAALPVAASEQVKGDPYPPALVATAEAVMATIGRPHKLASLDEGGPLLEVSRMVARLRESGVGSVVVAPLGTLLDELQVLAPLEALRTAGQAERAGGLVDSPRLAEAVSALVLEHRERRRLSGFS